MNKTSLSEAYIECRYDEYCHMFYGEFNDEKVCSGFHMCHDVAKIEYVKQSTCGESRLYKKGITGCNRLISKLCCMYQILSKIHQNINN